MNILIDKIRVKNFRALKDIEVNLKPITILVGANNAGKTTLLRALNSVLGITRNQINQDDLFIDKDGTQVSKEIIIDIRIIPIDEKWERLNEFDNKWNSKLLGGINKTFDKIGDFFAFRTVYNFGIEDTPTTSFYQFANWENEQLSVNEFKAINQIRNNIKMYFIDAQRDILEDSKQRTSFFGKLVSNLDYGSDLNELQNDIANINQKAIDKSDVLKHLKEELKKLNQTTQTQGEGVTLNPFPKKISDLHKGMKVYFQDNNSDAFSMENHGMGTRSWASIITAGAFTSWQTKQIDGKIEKGEETDLLFPLFALEEPEAHLHPNAQRTLYKQLKEFKGQKIVSTHSPYIAGQAELEELRHFYKDSDASVVSEIDLNGDLEIERKIKNEVIETRGELLFAKAIVTFEGQTEKLCLPIFAEKYFGCSAFELGVFFTDASGNNHRPFVKLAESLSIPWFIFSDYDQPNIQKGVKNALEFIGQDLNSINLISLNKSIEQYLLDSGYENEIKSGINKFFLSTCNETTPQQQIEAGQTRVNNWNIVRLMEELKKDDSKVKFPIYWSNEIIKREDNLCIPPKIRELFDKLKEQLNLKIVENEQSSTI
jgi:putative ATP-dependent endonuclease of OLD family